MVLIRSDQLRRFEQVAEARFVDRLVDHLIEYHCDATVRLPGEVHTVRALPKDKLKELVEVGIAQAKEFGLTWESTITGFVAIMFEVAPNFDEMTIAQTLRHAKVDPPDARLNLLLDLASASDWENAEMAYDCSKWLAPRH